MSADKIFLLISMIFCLIINASLTLMTHDEWKILYILGIIGSVAVIFVTLKNVNRILQEK